METQRATGARILVVEDDEHIRSPSNPSRIKDIRPPLSPMEPRPGDRAGRAIRSLDPRRDAARAGRGDSLPRHPTRVARHRCANPDARRAARKRTRRWDSNSGADDDLTKPFGVRQPVARVRALLRRRGSAAGQHAPQSRPAR